MRRWKQTILAQERNGAGQDLIQRRQFNAVLRGGLPITRALKTAGLGALLGSSGARADQGPHASALVESDTPYRFTHPAYMLPITPQQELIATKLTDYHPIQPLGQGITNEFYELGKTHPLYPELSLELDIPNGRVGVKMMHTSVPDGEDFEIGAAGIPAYRKKMEEWLDSKRAKPRSVELTDEQKNQLYPALTPDEYADVYRHLETIEGDSRYRGVMSSTRGKSIKPAMPDARTKGHKAIGTEIVTPIGKFRDAFEQLIPTEGILGVPAEYVWSVMFMHDIRQHFLNLQGDTLNDNDLLLFDTHEDNWGLRLQEKWVPAVKRLLAPYYGKDGAVDVLTLGNPTYRDTQITFSALPEDVQQAFEKLRESVYEVMFGYKQILPAPSDDYPYGPLVVLDHDHVSTGDDMDVHRDEDIEKLHFMWGDDELTPKEKRKVHRESYAHFNENIIPTKEDFKNIQHMPWRRYKSNVDKAIEGKCGDLFVRNVLDGEHYKRRLSDCKAPRDKNNRQPRQW